MKKYNLSNIMKRAWELVKKAGMTISSGLKRAWKEAKNTGKKIKMNVCRNEYFTVDTVTGKITGKLTIQKNGSKEILMQNGIKKKNAGKQIRLPSKKN